MEAFREADAWTGSTTFVAPLQGNVSLRDRESLHYRVSVNEAAVRGMTTTRTPISPSQDWEHQGLKPARSSTAAASFEVAVETAECGDQAGK